MIDRCILRPVGDNPPQARLIYGQDCLASLKALPDKSVHMIATSPPYFGLRDYGTATWEGGDPNCGHRVGGQVPDSKNPKAITAGVRPGADASHCRACGAKRIDDQLGLERTPEHYIQRLVAIFEEIRRVLRDDGVAWLNLGDSYVTPMKGIGGDKGFSAGGSKRENNRTQPKMADPIRSNYGDLKVKPKDILGIPWRVAFALQADGWTLRQDIVWAKNNPMPESVVDRCTRSHEYIFMLTKGERYFYDQESIKEPMAAESVSRYDYAFGGAKAEALTEAEVSGDGSRTHPIGKRDPSPLRNKRSVWTVNPKPYPGAHFATWPEELVSLMVKAGSSEKGCCSACGAPQSRMTKKRSRGWNGSKYGERAVQATGGAISGGTTKSTLGSSNGTQVNETVTVGWQPTCTCDAPLTPCTILDPFSGSATTGAVALMLGRNYIGLDLNEDYLDLAVARLEARPPKDGSSDVSDDDVMDLFE